MPTIAIRLSPLLIVMLLTSCAGFMQAHDQSTINTIKDELTVGAETKPVAPTPVEINDALLPPLKIEIPKTTAKKLEQRFDLVINNAPANQVLMGIVGGTRYSMLVHPDITGNISVNLKDVTVFEALDALRSLYGYEYKVDGSRIFIEQQSMQTRVFQVNYIVGQRRGSSDTRVTSGSISGGQNNQQGANNTGNTSQVTNNIGGSGNNNSRPLTSTSITTSSNNDFWQDLTDSLNGIVGNENGRRIIVNLQSGVIVVRAMPNEIRNVESFLRLMQVSIERQVILEAKIINVQLNDLSQSGVNWSIFGSSGSNTGIVGNINANTQLASSGNGNLISGDLAAANGNVIANAATTALGGPLFAIALQGANFSTLLSFLETQGDVQVLSSPRISSINNQKAVLKVGTDEFFVTGISSNTTASVGATTTVPEVILQPFFSGITLDVTPQIDKDDNIILHMHPSISQVSTVNKQVTLGGTAGQINLPLASSNISETDSIVRTRDGRVIVIGGLMTESATSSKSKVPGLGDVKGVGAAFRQQGASKTKSELVILLKASVVQGQENWANDMLSSKQRIEEMQRPVPTEDK
ncbi:MAG: pilus (MSHA type) biogenesis protein MshL [Methylotenera sp.]|uniref:pilus (MSHA type) biogenesis protein MshL n=1 Tax=Methylotenera sp. TaxID=2051956 RepID=UPI000D44F94A|nr:pilus (MSHA type) biogenesis protein MshL [Methylotenera sp.]MDP3211688.1 pilus (MSHA type) biogenesis protein MshL [Methylotenera sp.]MDP3776202.1 pilus (MSHA type) biogenesis protein MshL [Methylotenera sp.]PPC98221.1 MAG: pilus (MSHA type) biogenesis protein MshL [Methylotenera sp.]